MANLRFYKNLEKSYRSDMRSASAGRGAQGISKEAGDVREHNLPSRSSGVIRPIHGSSQSVMGWRPYGKADTLATA